MPGLRKPGMPAVHPEPHGKWKGGVVWVCTRARVDEMGPGGRPGGGARTRGGVKAQPLPAHGRGGRGEWLSVGGVMAHALPVHSLGGRRKRLNGGGTRVWAKPVHG